MASQTNNALPLQVAIIGGGPAGFYTAQALFRVRPDIQVDLYERLPSPLAWFAAVSLPTIRNLNVQSSCTNKLPITRILI